MNEGRTGHASIILPNGNVFTSGGDLKTSVEVYDTNNDQWIYADDMLDGRHYHSIYYLKNLNRLLIFGGAGTQETLEDTWETYDPVNLTPTNRGVFPIKSIHYKNSIQLNDDNIAMIGGEVFDIIDWGPIVILPTKNCYVLDIVTSLEEPVQLQMDFNLYQNYPNPFNPETTIKYRIGNGDREDFSIYNVSIKVYDLLGREAATLVNENKPAGVYYITFNASALVSGFYFYTLKTGNYSQTRKMLLIK